MTETIRKIHQFIQEGAEISIDSRENQQGKIFIAIKGENFDANRFAGAAVDKGAQLAIVDDAELPSNPKFLKVNNALETLQELAKYHRALLDIPVIAITGTNGKTTTKELLNAILSKKFNTLCTPGNFNNHIGLPLTILKLKKAHEIAIIEMGANHINEIGFLCTIAQPTSGLITNIGRAHMEGFGSEENILKAKTQLFEYLQKNHGLIFLNTDDKSLKNYPIKGKTITYGKDPENNYSGRKLSSTDPFLKVEFTNRTNPRDSHKLDTQLVGEYNLENILAACTVGSYYNVPPHLIQEAIPTYSPKNSRSQLKKSLKNTIIWDAYNANPTSMTLAIENFYQMPSSRKMLILGDMLELGNTAEKEHQNILKLVKNLEFDEIILIGEEFEKAQRKYPNPKTFKKVDDALAWITQNPLEGYTIMVKGSRGIELEKLDTIL